MCDDSKVGLNYHSVFAVCVLRFPEIGIPAFSRDQRALWIASIPVERNGAQEELYAAEIRLAYVALSLKRGRFGPIGKVGKSHNLVVALWINLVALARFDGRGPSCGPGGARGGFVSEFRRLADVMHRTNGVQIRESPTCARFPKVFRLIVAPPGLSFTGRDRA